MHHHAWAILWGISFIITIILFMSMSSRNAHNKEYVEGTCVVGNYTIIKTECQNRNATLCSIGAALLSFPCPSGGGTCVGPMKVSNFGTVAGNSSDPELIAGAKKAFEQGSSMPCAYLKSSRATNNPDNVVEEPLGSSTGLLFSGLIFLVITVFFMNRWHRERKAFYLSRQQMNQQQQQMMQAQGYPPPAQIGQPPVVYMGLVGQNHPQVQGYPLQGPPPQYGMQGQPYSVQGQTGYPLQGQPHPVQGQGYPSHGQVQLPVEGQPPPHYSYQ